MSEEMGISVKREEDFSKWFLEVVRKGDFKDQRTPTKGLDVLMPWGYAIWERIQEIMNKTFKENKIKNAYFPLLIPHKLIEKEKNHFEGFNVETADVTEVGGKPLEEKLALRPTSETIMYHMYSIWIRSHRDLPLKLNQWNNVIRFDTKITRPLIRDREFLWSEVHTAHAKKEEADEQVMDYVNICKDLHKKLGMTSMIMKRTKYDKFPGADYSIAFDTLVQDGKVFQGPGGHMLGQNFSIPFEIKFADEDGKMKYVWQTCLGTTTREIGGIIMQHGDDKGAVLPPELSPYQVVIIPILFKGKEKKITSVCKKQEEKMKKMGVRVYFDDRKNYSPGFKFNEWELKGVPVRIEIGPKDIEKNVITLVKRIDNKKIELKNTEKINEILDEIQNKMYKKSEKFLKENIKDCKDIGKIKSHEKGILRISFCEEKKCEDKINSLGVEVRGTLFDKKEKPFDECVACDKNAISVAYVAKSY